MNEKQEKKRRYYLRLKFIAHFNKWLDSEPPRWRFIRWRNGKTKVWNCCTEFQTDDENLMAAYKSLFVEG